MDLLVAFVVGAIVGAIAGYGIRAFISARRRARARRDRFGGEWALSSDDKAEPIRRRSSGKSWTEADEKKLLELIEAGKSEAEIGTVLHRTPGAVASRLKRLRRVHNNPSLVPDPALGVEQAVSSPPTTERRLSARTSLRGLSQHRRNTNDSSH